MSLLQEYFEGKIDFHGQKKVDLLARSAILIGCFVGFVFGFILQDLRVTFGIVGISTVIAALVVVPPWPMFNRHPVKWLPVKDYKEKKP